MNDPETGHFHWKVARYRKIKPGMRAGSTKERGVTDIFGEFARSG